MKKQCDLLIAICIFFTQSLTALPDLFVANRFDNTIAEFDISSSAAFQTAPEINRTVVGTNTDPTNPGPQALAINADTKKLYVANFLDKMIAEFDISSSAAFQTAPEINRTVVGTNTDPTNPGPQALAINADTKKLYVANFLDNTIAEFDISSSAAFQTAPEINRTVVGTNTDPTNPRPQALAINADTKKLYVANLNDNTIAEFDISSSAAFQTAPEINRKVVGTNTSPILPSPIALAINADTKKLYVANFDDDTIAEFDISSSAAFQTAPEINRKVVGTNTSITDPGPQALAINADTKKLYVANFDDDTIAEFDISSSAAFQTAPEINRTAVGTNTSITDPGPQALAINADTKKLYVANFFDNTIAEFDISSSAAFQTAPEINRKVVGTNTSITNPRPLALAILFPPPEASLLPPGNFRACFKHDRFLTQSVSIARLTWTASPSESVTGYRIFRNGKLIATQSKNAVCYNDCNACCDNCYEIAAIDSAGNESARTRPR